MSNVDDIQVFELLGTSGGDGHSANVARVRALTSGADLAELPSAYHYWLLPRQHAILNVYHFELWLTENPNHFPGYATYDWWSWLEPSERDAIESGSLSSVRRAEIGREIFIHAAVPLAKEVGLTLAQFVGRYEKGTKSQEARSHNPMPFAPEIMQRVIPVWRFVRESKPIFQKWWTDFGSPKAREREVTVGAWHVKGRGMTPVTPTPADLAATERLDDAHYADAAKHQASRMSSAERDRMAGILEKGGDAFELAGINPWCVYGWRDAEQLWDGQGKRPDNNAPAPKSFSRELTNAEWKILREYMPPPPIRRFGGIVTEWREVLDMMILYTARRPNWDRLPNNSGNRVKKAFTKAGKKYHWDQLLALVNDGTLDIDQSRTHELREVCELGVRIGAHARVKAERDQKA